MEAGPLLKSLICQTGGAGDRSGIPGYKASGLFTTSAKVILVFYLKGIKSFFNSSLAIVATFVIC